MLLLLLLTALPLNNCPCAYGGAVNTNYHCVLKIEKTISPNNYCFDRHRERD